jgi:hypothetical protein
MNSTSAMSLGLLRYANVPVGRTCPVFVSGDVPSKRIRTVAPDTEHMAFLVNWIPDVQPDGGVMPRAVDDTVTSSKPQGRVRSYAPSAAYANGARNRNERKVIALFKVIDLFIALPFWDRIAWISEAP